MNGFLDTFMGTLAERLEVGARQLKNKSLKRKVHEIEREIWEELVDKAGWCYVLWVMASRKSAEEGTEQQLRQLFLDRIRHRVMRNDRSSADTPPGRSAQVVMSDLEILVVDIIDQAEQITRRLAPLARALEVARWLAPPMRGRRGGHADWRSSD